MNAHDSILVADDDPFVLGMLTHVGETRGLNVVGVTSAAKADAALRHTGFAVVVADLRLGSDSGLDVIRRARDCDGTTEAIVISADQRLSSALESYALDIFAFVPKPFDPAQLFSMVDRAREHRRDQVERRRLTWELKLLNEVAATVSASFEVGDVCQAGLDRVAEAYGVRWAVLRLQATAGAGLEVRAVHGAPLEVAREFFAQTPEWPSTECLVHRRPVRIEEIPSDALGTFGADYPARSLVSVPVVAAADTLGVLTLVADEPRRFSVEDERVLLAIGRQFGVAVANSQLYERVHRAKVQWERTFDAISDPIALFDRDARTMRINAALARLRGWDIRETQGRSCAEVGLCGGGCPGCLVGRAVAGEPLREQEVATADGRIFLVTTLPVPDAAGAAVQFAKEMTEERRRARQLSALSEEVTAANAEMAATLERLRTTQAQLVQAEKLSAIGQLVAGVAHELNNPLTSVVGYAQLVHDEVLSQPALVAAGQGLLDDVSRIVSESDRAARIVRNLLTFSRRQAAERVPQELDDVCARVVELRAYDFRIKGIEVTIAIPAGLPRVSVDGGQIQQALLNLVLNAEQAMRDVIPRRLRIEAHAEPACGAVVLTVTDSGHGIAPGDLARVFDPFFTTRPVGKGTGLGLSIVYGIVRDHGGQVWAKSAPGQGTSFFVRLPAVPPAELAGRGVALVAHGDSVTRDFVGAALAGWGWHVRSALNAREAVESLREDAPRLVVVDRSVAIEPQPWSDAWAGCRGGASLVGLGPLDDESGRLIRDAAAAVLPGPYDLCSLWRALVALAPGARSAVQ